MNAHKVFISNGGWESLETAVGQVPFDGGPDRAYNEFYAALKDWGSLELTASPADADLVFEISWKLSNADWRLPILGALRLVVVDPKTHVSLWTVTEYVRGAALAAHRDKNFDQTMNTVVTRLKTLMAPSVATTASDVAK